MIQHPVRLIVDWFFRCCICYFFLSQYMLHDTIRPILQLYIMSYEFHFKKLRKLTLKQISTEHHISNLRAYILPIILYLKGYLSS